MRLNGELVAAPRPVTVKPGEISPQIFFATQTNDGVFTLHSTLKDDLAVDNDASIVSLLPHPVNVLLVTAGNRMLEKALRFAPNVRLTTAATLLDDGSAYDIVVLDGIVPAVWPVGNVLAINVMQTNWFEGVSRGTEPAIVDWRPTHPVLRYVSFDNVWIATNLVVKTPSWGVSLVDSAQSPLIVGGDLGRQRILWIGFDVLDSSWPWKRVLSDVHGQCGGLAEPGHHPQQPAPGSRRRPVPPGADAAGQLRANHAARRDGQETAGANQRERGGIWGHHARGGLSFESRHERNDLLRRIAGRGREQHQTPGRDTTGNTTHVSATTLHRANMELWRTVAGIALAVLLFEWWYYHRRTV